MGISCAQPERQRLLVLIEPAEAAQWVFAAHQQPSPITQPHGQVSGCYCVLEATQARMSSVVWPNLRILSSGARAE
jgi:hypothetical protein